MTFLMLFLLGCYGMWQKAETVTLGRTLLTGPSGGLLKNTVYINCTLDPIPANLSILYQLFQEGKEKHIGEYSAHSGETGEIPLYIRKDYDGMFHCKASAHNNSEITPSFSEWHRFRVLELVAVANITANETTWEGDSLTLQCNIIQGSYVSYDWLRNDNPVQFHYNSSQNILNIPSLNLNDNGKYTCVASNQLDGLKLSTANASVDIWVKEPLSEPEISSLVIKNEDGTFSSHVTCGSSKGSRPINFSLLNDTQSIAEELSETLKASFIVPVTLDQDMGMVRCQADNGKQMWSKLMNLTVESIGGAVTMILKKAVGQDFEVLGVWLYCHVERGTHINYHWFLNNTKLENRGEFYFLFDPDHSGLSLALNPSSAGIYHCEAVNLFDNTSSVRSAKALITREALNKVQNEVAAIVFTCFSLMIIAVFSCCIYGVVLRKRESRKQMYRIRDHLTEMYNVLDDATEEEYKSEVNDYEDDHGDMESSSYTEDMGVVQASRMAEPDESEEEDENESYYGTDKEIY